MSKADSAVDKPQTFRPSFAVILGLLLVLGALSAAVMTRILQESGAVGPSVWSLTFLRILLIIYLWAMVCTVFVVWTFSVRVGVEGIHGRTFWGQARSLKWADVITVRRIGPWPFRFLRLFSKDGGAPLWMPLFVKRRKRLQDRIVMHTAAGHPL